MTEYTQMKRLCLAIPQVCADVKRTEANHIIASSCQAAFDSLDGDDRELVQQAAFNLQNKINSSKFGLLSALEVLASVAGFMEGSE